MHAAAGHLARTPVGYSPGLQELAAAAIQQACGGHQRSVPNTEGNPTLLPASGLQPSVAEVCESGEQEEWEFGPVGSRTLRSALC